MNKIFNIITSAAVVTLFASCADELNIPLTQELPDEVKLKDESLRSDMDYISSIMADWLAEDATANAKYSSVTYRELYDYEAMRKAVDRDEVFKEHLQKYPSYPEAEARANAEIDKYRGMHPDSLLKIEFVGKKNSKNFLDYYVHLQFRVTPLKGEIDQFAFNYTMPNKMSSPGKYKSKDDEYMFYKKPIHGPTIVTDTQSLLGSGTLYSQLEDLTYEEIVKNYDFFYEISDVQYNGMSYRSIPLSIREYLFGDEIMREYYYNQVIEEVGLDDSCPITPTDYYNNVLSEKSENYNSKLYHMIIEMYEWYFEDMKNKISGK